MLALTPAFVPARAFPRLIWLMAAGLLLPLLLTAWSSPLTGPRAQPAGQTMPANVSEPITATDMPEPIAPPSPPIPPALRPVLHATLAAESGTDYAVFPLTAPDEGWQAANPAQQFTTIFSVEGVRLAPRDGTAWIVRPTEIRTVAGHTPLAPVPPVRSGPRVEYRREGLTEWYINGPRGLEQGFTLAAPPAGGEQFTLALTLTGAAATATSSDTLMIGELGYRDLVVVDARGTTLPARLVLTEGAVGIAVDARGAQWPVTIDPLITQATLASGVGTAYAFGFSTAIATTNGTNTIVVGAPSELVGTQDEQGAAYVFTGSGSTYTQQARLLASDGSHQHRFGNSVAITLINGTTTVVVGAPNAAKTYVYTSSGGAFIEQARLVSPNPTNNDYFGGAVAAVASGGTTLIAIGAFIHTVGGSVGQGSVYLFAGSGASYPLQVELNDPNGHPYEGFGASVALASSGGTNTLAVGAINKSIAPVYNQGSVFIFTGSGTRYSVVEHFSPNGQTNGNLGTAIAVGVKDGVTTVAASQVAPEVVYVFTGSGTSYTTTALTDAGGAFGDGFGASVAVGFSYSQTLVVVGTPRKNGNPAGGLLLFSQNGASYVQTSLPPASLSNSGAYGYGAAMVVGPNQNPTVVAGTPIFNGTEAGTASIASWDASASVQAIFGDHSQSVASPTGTFSGTPFHLVARVVDGNGAPLPATALTFAVRPSGATTGRFTAADPASTSLHVLTRDGTGGTTAGQTDTLALFPSDTAGTFAVTASADGSAVTATFTLTILPSAPVPTINPVIPLRATARQGSSSTVTRQPPGLSPAMLLIDPNQTYELHITGTGFVSQTLGTTSFFKVGTAAPIQMDTVYNSATDLSVWVTGYNMLAGLTADTTAQITVYNPPSSAGASDGGYSNPVTLVLAMPRAAPTGSRLACSGATSILALASVLIVPPPCQVMDGQGQPIPGIATGIATGFVGSAGGELVGTGGGTIISNDGASIISEHGAGIISNDGASLITNDGGSIVAQGGGNSLRKDGPIAPTLPAPTARGSSAPAPRPALRTAQTGRTSTFTRSVTGDYLASTDVHGIIMAPPVAANGIPGTVTRSLAVTGVTQPITYTITTLNPHDGHPTTITALSRSTASAGDPAFPLTVTGTGFIPGSVLAYGGVQLVTTYRSPTEVSATVPAALLHYTGVKEVRVINPDPNGGASLPASFIVTPRMAVSTLAPTLIAAGSSGFTLTVTGTNFAGGMTVTFNGTPLATTVVSTTTLRAIVPAPLIATAGTAAVAVMNALGSVSNGVAFTIEPLTPLPPGQPTVSPTRGPVPLPPGRPTVAAPVPGGTPVPLPPGR